MRILTHLEKDTKQDLAMNAAILISELLKRFKIKRKEITNIVNVAEQMATLESDQEEM